MAEEDDWRLDEGEDLRGATFVLLPWTPPPPEWVAVYRNEDGSIGLVRRRTEPGEPGWKPDHYPVWDHDHCEICMQRLTHNPEYEDGQLQGWRTGEDPGSYEWVCMSCFEDLRERLDWKVATP